MEQNRGYAPARIALALALVATLGCAEAGGGETGQPDAVESTAVQVPPAPDPADVESPETLVRAVYDVISGERGEARDWDRWHSLFFPGAMLHPVGPADGSGEGWTVSSMTPADFVELVDSSFVADGFYEVEIGDVTEVYGNIAHRFSSYASFRSSTETEPFNRGINSFQLLDDGDRWWVLSIFWQHEFQAGQIPEKYLYRP
ncbi:MAG: hypothetical protein OEO23_08500 [Gemmatimonadota bacterium]|nr:hypothetical protein [Gemmatimonadota bacterium]